MKNLFRHWKIDPPLTKWEKLTMAIQAVRWLRRQTKLVFALLLVLWLTCTLLGDVLWAAKANLYLTSISGLLLALYLLEDLIWKIDPDFAILNHDL